MLTNRSNDFAYRFSFQPALGGRLWPFLRAQAKFLLAWGKRFAQTPRSFRCLLDGDFHSSAGPMGFAAYLEVLGTRHRIGRISSSNSGPEPGFKNRGGAAKSFLLRGLKRHLLLGAMGINPKHSSRRGGGLFRKSKTCNYAWATFGPRVLASALLGAGHSKTVPRVGDRHHGQSIGKGPPQDFSDRLAGEL